MNHRRGFSYSSVVFLTSFVIVAVLLSLCVHRWLFLQEFFRVQDNYSACYATVAKIEHALHIYALANKGEYPKQLSDLVPKYLEKIPPCPECGKDTYSSSYVRFTPAPSYFFCCSGQNHDGPENTPQAVSDLRYFSDKSRNPMNWVYEDGNMPKILKLHSDLERLMNGKKFADALICTDTLLSLQSVWREKIFTDRARCFFELGSHEKGIESLENALRIRFEISDWLPLKPWMENSRIRYDVQKMLREYIRIHKNDIAVRIYLLCVLDGKSDDTELENMYRQTLENLKSNQGLYAYELFLEARILMLEGKYDEANAYFLKVMQAPLTDDTLQQLVFERSGYFISVIRKRTKS